MKKRTLCLLMALLLLCSLVFAACAKRPESAEPTPAEPEAAQTGTEPVPDSVTPEPTPEATAEPTPEPTATPEPTPEPVYTNPLSGEITKTNYAGKRPVAVMIEDNHTTPILTINQAGISRAEIFYEIQVEQITRNMALFMDIESVPALYPIRSARTYFVSSALAYDAIYVHCGESAEGLDFSSNYLQFYTDNDNLDLGTDVNSYRMAEWPHVGEHGLGTSGEILTNYMQSLGTRMEHREPDFDYGLHFTDNAVPENGETANTVRICFPSNKITFLNYNAEKGGYSLNQWNADLIDDTTKELTIFQNVLVLSTPTQIGIDDKYHSALAVENYEGSGWFCNGGKMEPITWKRGLCTADSLYNPFRYFKADGTELELQVGHSYIAFTSSTYGGPTFS